MVFTAMRITDQKTEALPGALKLLSEPLRLRMLGLLDRDELAVGELSRALDLSQSRVSNHLRHLRESGLLAERHVGTSTFLRLAPPREGDPVTARLWGYLREELGGLAEHAADLVRLERILRERRGREGELFDRMADDWDRIAGAFTTGQARHRTASHLLPRDFVAADLGCGIGYMAASLLGIADRLICVDRSPRMLDEARARLSRNPRGTRLEFRQGELASLPIADGEVDGAMAGMILHHLGDLDRGVRELARILTPGGALCILELAPHGETWMREELGDRHLGLEATDVIAALERARFEEIILDPVEDRYRPRRLDAAPDDENRNDLSLYIVRARAPRTTGSNR
jgi:DNA-binding transcriptional ArsR family regulator